MVTSEATLKHDWQSVTVEIESYRNVIRRPRGEKKKITSDSLHLFEVVKINALVKLQMPCCSE